MADEDVHEVAIADSDVRFPVAEGERILAAARRAGVWLPFECGWGSCGTCKITLVEGEVDPLFPQAPAITPRDARRGRILACQSTPVSNLVVKPTWVSNEPREEFPTATCDAVLVEEEDLGPDIRRFRFELDRPAAYREGQHAIIDVGGGIRRCYSMANLSGDGVVEFVAKRYEGGVGSVRLFSLGRGAQTTIELPYGEMWLRQAPEPVCLVAGGTGIAPILGLLRLLVRSQDPRPVHVFFGANTQPELVCWDEITDLTRALERGHAVGVLAKPDSDWDGSRGFVTDALAESLAALSHARFYVAGPPVMTDAVLSLLRDHGVGLDKVHYDSFG